ncbi:MAG: large conductance mechanosensitive channel protein MscL [Micavibrio aeruginosavorus]|uniref:Large-conductance mechanosensitive channel n=1 Tax=Micavibrio aeruginosavorus TaxID=349221 RepID=A0A2W5FSB5_9BACT|nr:MAG: large conductance mechanosensitive channel protein MscL [Micavibrio aeruginosavorus]
MAILHEFKTFIARGNVFDLAVGIIIGAAFTGIVNSLVTDIFMPVFGMITSGINFSDLFVTLDGNSYATIKAAKDAGAPIITYGVFVNNVINFLIVSFVVFMLVKQVNRLKKDPPPAATPEDVLLLREIRDSLKK